MLTNCQGQVRSQLKAFKFLTGCLFIFVNPGSEVLDTLILLKVFGKRWCLFLQFFKYRVNTSIADNDPRKLFVMARFLLGFRRGSNFNGDY